MKKRKQLLSRCLPFILAAGVASQLNAQVFVIGDGFTADGSGNFDLAVATNNGSDTGTTSVNGSAGNTVESVYRVDNGNGANPFNGGNAGGTFNPISIGNVFGTDYRATINFDLSSLDLSAIAAPPAGQQYQITSIELFLELSSPDVITGGSVDVDIYTNTGLTIGGMTQTPDTTFTVLDSASGGSYIAPIALELDSIDLGNQSNFEITLDVADPNNGVRFGASLSTAADPNFGINGTTVVEVAPRLRITTELVAVPEPSTAALLSIFSLCMISRRSRK